MALRDAPYLPLYVNDFTTDEKLNNCSAESTGVYIRLMCLMHKSQTYGKVLLRQKDRQNERQVLNFAAMLARHMPYSIETIARSLDELLEEGVIYLDGDELCQKRMIHDGIVSERRSENGKKGAEQTNSRFKQSNEFAAAKHSAKHSANVSANSENENEYEIEDEINKKEINGEIQIPFDGALLDAFNDWIAYKEEKRQPYKPRGLKSLISQISRYAEQFGDTATANAIRDSMASNYQGIVFDRIGKGQQTDTRRRAKAPSEYTTKGSFFDVDT